MNHGQESVTRMRNLIHRRGLKLLLQAIDYLLHYQGLTRFPEPWTDFGDTYAQPHTQAWSDIATAGH